MDRDKKIKIAIVILAILLGISLIVLGTIIAKKMGMDGGTALVPDNYITQEEGGDSNNDTGNANSNGSAGGADNGTVTPDDNTQAAGLEDSTGVNTSDSQNGATQRSDSGSDSDTEDTDDSNQGTDGGSSSSGSGGGTSSGGSPSGGGSSSGSSTIDADATLELYDKQLEDNEAFDVSNMLPGDRETKHYRIKVSYHGNIKVYFKAEIDSNPLYQKLSEVMKVKVTLLPGNTLLYDGLMRDMPSTVSTSLSSAESTVGELHYEITAYLDTSVGNDYQNRDLKANFKWWAEGVPSSSGSGGSGRYSGGSDTSSGSGSGESSKTPSTDIDNPNTPDDTGNIDNPDDSSNIDNPDNSSRDSDKGEEGKNGEPGRLDPIPKTGDSMNIFIWSGILVISLTLLILLATRKKSRKEEQDGK